MNQDKNKEPGEDAPAEDAGELGGQDASAPEDAAEEGAAEEDGSESVGPVSGEDEIAALKDKLLRALAEAENVRRRSERQVTEARNYAVTNFARDLLAVPDNLRRALDALSEGSDGQAKDMKAFIDGVEMTERELLTVLDRHGIRKIVPDGEKFDHNLHQAMFEVEDSDAKPGMVVKVIQPGYVLKDRLLRPAMVGVAKARPDNIEGVDETV